MATQTKWDLLVGLAGVLYLAMVLFLGFELPVVGIALLFVTGYSLIRPHRANSRSHWK